MSYKNVFVFFVVNNYNDSQVVVYSTHNTPLFWVTLFFNSSETFIANIQNNHPGLLVLTGPIDSDSEKTTSPHSYRVA